MKRCTCASANSWNGQFDSARCLIFLENDLYYIHKIFFLIIRLEGGASQRSISDLLDYAFALKHISIHLLEELG